MGEWNLTKDKLPEDDGNFIVKFRNGKTARARYDSLDDVRPFCPLDGSKKYGEHGYPREVTVAWKECEE